MDKHITINVFPQSPEAWWAIGICGVFIALFIGIGGGYKAEDSANADPIAQQIAACNRMPFEQKPDCLKTIDRLNRPVEE